VSAIRCQNCNSVLLERYRSRLLSSALNTEDMKIEATGRDANIFKGAEGARWVLIWIFLLILIFLVLAFALACLIGLKILYG
jgi:hypothetical protein